MTTEDKNGAESSAAANPAASVKASTGTERIISLVETAAEYGLF